MPAQWGEGCCRAGEGGPRGGVDTWKQHTIQPRVRWLYKAPEELWTQKRMPECQRGFLTPCGTWISSGASPFFVFPVCKMSRWNVLGAWGLDSHHYFATLFWSHLFRLPCMFFIKQELAFSRDWDNTWESLPCPVRSICCELPFRLMGM